MLIQQFSPKFGEIHLLYVNVRLNPNNLFPFKIFHGITISNGRSICFVEISALMLNFSLIVNMANFPFWVVFLSG